MSAPIFIVGSGRSGTTLLRMMLCAHPRIYLTHEAYFYVWDALWPRELTGEAFVAKYLLSFNFRWLKLDPAEFLAGVPRDLPRDQARVLFEAVMSAKARQHGKPRFGDKTPAHSQHLARIFRDFPDARVIRMVRDPRAVAHSLSRMPWASQSALLGACVADLERRQVAPFRERMLQVRLEDLLADPRAVMTSVLNYVDEPWDERVLDHAAFGPGPDDLPPLPWFRAAAERRSASGRAPWEGWQPATLRAVERVAKRCLAEGGYAPAQLSHEPSLYAVGSAAMKELPQALSDLVQVRRLIQASRNPRVLLDATELEASFRRLNPPAWQRMPDFQLPSPPRLAADWQRHWPDSVSAAPAAARPQATAQARLLLTPFYAASIWLEAELARAYPEWPLRFPRDLTELERAPALFFELLQRARVFSQTDTLVELRRRGRMLNEPDKDRTAAIIELVVQRGETREVHPMFVKVQSGRGMPLLLQAVRAAVEPGIAREVDFYRRLAGNVPLRTARPLIAEAMTAYNRVFLATEYVAGHNPADWRGCPLPGMRAMLRDIARLNATFVGRTTSDPRTSWIPARAGLDYASFVATLAGSPPAWYMDLWQALGRYFCERPITLVHGDCRPGNMLFRDNGEMARHRHPSDDSEANPWPAPDTSAPEVTFTDWEAVNAAPLLWDFTYCTVIGLRSADRRAHQPRLLEEFVATLRAQGVSAELCDMARCQLEVELLTIVLYYVAALVVSKGYWDNQGNTLEDFQAWSGRILDALRGVNVGHAAQALGIEPEAILRLQREAAFAARARKLSRASSTQVEQILREQGDAGWLRLTEQYGRVFRYQGGVVSADPTDFQALLSLRPHTRKRPLPHRFADRFVPGAQGILFKDGDAWKKRLRPLMTGFNPQAVLAQEARLKTLVEQHIAGWQALHQGPDLFAEMTELGLYIALVQGYNLDPSHTLVRELGQTLVAYKASTMHPDARRRLDDFGLDWRKFADLPRLGAAFYEFRGHARRLEQLVAEIQRQKPWADPSRQGWVQTLAAAGLQGRELSDELNHLYGAFTAADYTTTCALAELAHAPDWARRVQQADLAGDTLDAILRETSRRYPVAMVIYRQLGQALTLGGETFPEGTLVMALPYALNHDAAWWERPLDFDPGRWQRPLSPRAVAAYEPFLKGPRRCIGEDFARQQLRVVLSTLLSRFHLEVTTRPRVNGFVIPRLAQPLAFRFERRLVAQPAPLREQHDARPAE